MPEQGREKAAIVRTLKTGEMIDVPGPAKVSVIRIDRRSVKVRVMQCESVLGGRVQHIGAVTDVEVKDEP